jgi:hypothetical protein
MCLTVTQRVQAVKISEAASVKPELERRHVYKVAVAYALVPWLLIQVATQVFPFFKISNWAVRLVVLLQGG